MKKRILITGGAGFIGSAIVEKLQKNLENEIFVIDDLSFGKLEFLNLDNDKFFKEDILNRDSIFKIVKNISPTIIIHLAAIHFIPYCNLHPFEASNININGTINILEAAKQSGTVKKIFFASTAAVYPISDFPISETDEVCPLDIYGLSKLVGEHLCNEFHLATNIPTIICRFFNAFGPNETNPHLIPEIALQINKGDRVIKLGNLLPKRDFIHTYDMATAVEKLIEKFDRGIDTFNLGRGEEYSVIEIVELFEKALIEKIEISVDPARERKVERMHLLANISKLKRYLNWEPTIDPEYGISTLLKGNL